MLSAKRSVLLMCLAFVASQGCNANKEAVLRNDLKSLGLAYISYYDENRKSPANWDELIAFAKQSDLSPDAIQRVRDAGYEVTWNADLNALPEGAANTVLAKKSTGDGPQLMMDGSVP